MTLPGFTSELSLHVTDKKYRLPHRHFAYVLAKSSDIGKMTTANQVTAAAPCGPVSFDPNTQCCCQDIYGHTSVRSMNGLSCFQVCH
jgi:hypothetical protein